MRAGLRTDVAGTYHKPIRDKGLRDIDELPREADTGGIAKLPQPIGERNKVKPPCDPCVNECAQIRSNVLRSRQTAAW